MFTSRNLRLLALLAVFYGALSGHVLAQDDLELLKRQCEPGGGEFYIE